MAPRYMADKSFGKSLYNTDFNGRKVRVVALLAYIAINVLRLTSYCTTETWAAKLARDLLF